MLSYNHTSEKFDGNNTEPSVAWLKDSPGENVWNNYDITNWSQNDGTNNRDRYCESRGENADQRGKNEYEANFSFNGDNQWGNNNSGDLHGFDQSTQPFQKPENWFISESSKSNMGARRENGFRDECDLNDSTSRKSDSNLDNRKNVFDSDKKQETK